MAPSPAVHIVCSDQHRNGKTLLARVLVDFLMIEGRDPLVIALSSPEGPPRRYFPGRTALVDFAHVTGQMKAFDTIMSAPNRDYLIDIPAQHLETFCQSFADLKLGREIRAAGLPIVVLFIIDNNPESLRAATAIEAALAPDVFIPVRNEMVGSALPQGFGGLVLTMSLLDEEVQAIVSERRFSFRLFQLGEEAAVPLRLRPNLKTFLHGLMSGFGDISPALSLLKLRG